MANKKVIVYVDLGDGMLPIVCSSIVEDIIKDGFVKLTNVSSIKDNKFPFIKVQSMCIPKDSIKYYVEGEVETVKEIQNEQKDDLAKTNDTKEDTWNWK